MQESIRLVEGLTNVRFIAAGTNYLNTYLCIMAENKLEMYYTNYC